MTAADVAIAANTLADALLIETSCTTEAATRALDRLRRTVRGSAAAVWLVDSSHATRVLQVGAAATYPPDTIIDLGDEAASITRLPHGTTLLHHAADLSRLQPLLSPGARSFVTVNCRSRGTVGVFVIGWTGSVPPCDATAAPYFRLAATVLVGALTRTASPATSAVSSAILESLSDRVAVIDGTGAVLALNGAWTDFDRRHADSRAESRPSADYLEASLQTAVSAFQAASIRQGIEAVRTGGCEGLDTAYPCDTGGERQWVALTARPLRGFGGAVVVQSSVSGHRLTAIARAASEGRFHDLADVIPVLMRLIDPDGRIRYANQRCVDGVGRSGARFEGVEWTDDVHPDDRGRAAAAFSAAVHERKRCDLELRVRASDGTYRWCAWAAEPWFDPDGRLEYHVAVASDISGKRRAEAALSQVAAQLVAAQESESSRIARELHDDLGQQVALLASRLDALGSMRQATLKRMRSGLKILHRDLQDIASTVHTLSHRLHPAKLRLLGLVPTLAALCRDLAKQGAMRVEFSSSDVPPNLPEDAALCIFRVTQEALQNAVKHSGARHITVHLTGAGSLLRLRVSDDGSGFDPLASRSAGLGLLTMRERVELTGGTLTIDAAVSHGSRIEAVVPMRSGSPLVPSPR